MKKDKLLLITGSSGMLGSSLTAEFVKKGFGVVGCDIKEPSYKSPGFVFENIDLVNKKEVSRLFQKHSFGKIIHTAACIKLGELTESERSQVFEANVSATSNLVSECEEHKVEKFIFTSSMTVYGLPHHLPVAENHPKNPLDFYGKSKLMAENVITGSKLKHVILRFPGILSPKRKAGAIYNFVVNSIRNEDIHITAKSPTPWEVIFLKDAVSAVLASVDNENSEGVFNIGYGEEIELTLLAEKVKRLCNSHSDIINDYPIKHPGFYMNTEKAKQVLNIRFPSLTQRLKEFVQVCQDKQ